MSVKEVNEVEMKDLLGSHDDKMFSITFEKRTNGELRDMTCRKGVKKGVTGAGRKGWDESSKKGLMTVYDMNKVDKNGRGAFRMINLDSVRRFKLNGQEYRVKRS